MKLLKPILLVIAFVCIAASGFAQKGYAPFKFDKEDPMLTLNIKESSFVKKFGPVMQKHHRNPTDAGEWSGLFDTIVALQDTDLSISGDLTFDSEDDVVKIVGTKQEAIDAAMKAIRPVIASPDKLEAFLADYDNTLERANAKKK